MGVGWQCPKGERWLCPPTASALTAAGLGQDSGHVENTAERSGAGGLPDKLSLAHQDLCVGMIRMPPNAGLWDAAFRSGEGLLAGRG